MPSGDTGRAMEALIGPSVPFSARRIIRRSLLIYREKFWLLLFFGVLFWLVLFGGISLPYIEERHYLILYWIVLAITLLGALAVSSVGMIRIASELLMGREASLQSAFNWVRVRHIFGLWWTLLLQMTLVIPGFFLLVIPGVFLALRFFVGWPVVVVEGKIGREALARSWELTRGRGSEVVRVYFLLLLLQVCASLIIGIIIPLIIGFVFGEGVGLYLAMVFRQLANLLVLPMYAIAPTIMYYDFVLRFGTSEDTTQLGQLYQKMYEVQPLDPRPSKSKSEEGRSVPVVHCWRCKAPIEVAPEVRGRKKKCPSCGTRQSMPT